MLVASLQIYHKTQKKKNKQDLEEKEDLVEEGS